jgi:outer membrane protein TolC
MRIVTVGAAGLLTAAGLLAAAPPGGQFAAERGQPAQEKGAGRDRPPGDRPAAQAQEAQARPLADSVLPAEAAPVDLASALRLAGVQNPDILLARERVVEAVALQQLAAAQLLPDLNAGANYDNHTGPLQRATGQILEVHRSALYLGLGANAVGAGTVTIPGIVWSGNLSQALFGALIPRQVVRQREFESVAVRNTVLLQVATGYLELLRAEGRRAIAVQTRDEAREVARVTANYATTGQGRQADADRAATELEQRNADFLRAEEAVLTASARLTQLLSLPPAPRLHAIDGWVVPAPLVPDPLPLTELVAIALLRRPELAARQAAVRAALLQLTEAKALPFAPTAIVGFSDGRFGGGSDLVANGIRQADRSVVKGPRFGDFGDRQDFDAVLYWTARNLGLGNLALIDLAKSNLRGEELRGTIVLDRIRAEVATAYAATHARFAQIETASRAVEASQRAFRQDLVRTRNREGLPIEVLDSLRLLGRSRYAYLDAIVDYNRAQFELYVALGQPPADCLARPVPADLVPPPEPQPAPANP